MRDERKAQTETERLVFSFERPQSEVGRGGRGMESNGGTSFHLHGFTGLLSSNHGFAGLQSSQHRFSHPFKAPEMQRQRVLAVGVFCNIPEMAGFIVPVLIRVQNPPPPPPIFGSTRGHKQGTAG